MTAPDLTPAVRDAAIAAADAILCDWVGEDTEWAAPPVVVAVVAVVAPEIERPLQARIEELEAERRSPVSSEQYPHDGLSCAEVEQEVTRLAEENRVLKGILAGLVNLHDLIEAGGRPFDGDAPWANARAVLAKGEKS